MSFIIQYVAESAPWIYAICGGIALYYLYKSWMVRRERRQAVFSLEREKAMGDLYSIFLAASLLLLIMGATYFTSTTLATAVGPLVEGVLAPAPPLLSIPTLTATPLPVTPTATWTPTLAPVEQVAQAATVESVATAAPATPTPPALLQPICPDPHSTISAPGMNQAVSGAVTVIGSAHHANFWYYKLEYTAGTGEGFGYFDGGENQVRDGYLGVFNSAAVPNGVYTIRLVVVDRTGNYPPSCRVTISVQN